MKVQAKAGASFARYEDSDAGEGLAIFFSQSATDVVRWRFDVYALLDTGVELLVGWFFVSPPSATVPIGQLTRQVGAAVCPGAKSWSVLVSPASDSQSAENESADITLTSSKCCTAPVGSSRVGERYGYRAGTTPGAGLAVAIQPGMTVTRIMAIGLAGGGTFQITSGGDMVTIPAGAQVYFEPQALIRTIPGSSSITFTNVNYAIEFKESA